MCLAIDAGGTSTRALLIAADGDCVGYGRAGGGNPVSWGPEAAARSVTSAVAAALEHRRSSLVPSTASSARAVYLRADRADRARAVRLLGTGGDGDGRIQRGPCGSWLDSGTGRGRCRCRLGESTSRTCWRHSAPERRNCTGTPWWPVPGRRRSGWWTVPWTGRPTGWAGCWGTAGPGSGSGIGRSAARSAEWTGGGPDDRVDGAAPGRTRGVSRRGGSVSRRGRRDRW